jgi:hypothetical protein
MVGKKKTTVLNIGAAKVITFDETRDSLGLDSKSYRQFMKTSVKIQQQKPSKSEQLFFTKAYVEVSKDFEKEKELLKMDLELENLLNTTKIINEYTNSHLKGRERLNKMKEQIQLLGGKKEKNEKRSLPMFVGMKKQAQKRVDKKIAEAKNLGMATDLNKKFIIDQEKILIPKKVYVKKKVELVKTKNFKNGIMKVSQHKIDKIENGGKAKKKSKFGNRKKT